MRWLWEGSAGSLLPSLLHQAAPQWVDFPG